MDGIPISEHLDRADARFAKHWWHSFFFAQPDIPERVINADPDSWYRGDPASMGHNMLWSIEAGINESVLDGSRQIAQVLIKHRR